MVIVSDGQSADGGYLCLKIFLCNSIIADERICHNHGLIGIGGVRDDLLVSYRRGVEYDFRDSFFLGAKSIPIVLAAILQNHLSVKLFHPIHLFLSNPPGQLPLKAVLAKICRNVCGIGPVKAGGTVAFPACEQIQLLHRQIPQGIRSDEF